MVIMAGTVGELREPAAPTASLGVTWVGNSMGGAWCEFGVLHRRSPFVSSFGGEKQFSEVLEVSGGFLIGAPSRSAYPFLRCGFGLYHDESPASVFDMPPYMSRPVTSDEWMPGFSMGIGSRFTIPGSAVAPTIEGRWHQTHIFEDDKSISLFTLSAGLWFR